MSDILSLSEIQETFSLMDDWEDRYAYLIDLGRKLPPFLAENRIDDYIVKGCTSQVWMMLTIEGDKVRIEADSDAHIVRGLIALVIAVYDGQKTSDIAGVDMEQIFDGLGLSEHLSPNRRNGFFAMVGQIQSIG